MADRQDRRADVGSPERPDLGKARVPWWAAALIGMGGLLVGVLLVGVLSVTNPSFVQEKDAAVADPAAQPSSQSTIEVEAQAQVNSACLRVINEAQDVFSILSDANQAVTEVDLKRLDDMVRRLDPIQQRLEQDLIDCEIKTSAGSSPAPGATPRVPGASPQQSGSSPQVSEPAPQGSDAPTKPAASPTPKPKSR